MSTNHCYANVAGIGISTSNANSSNWGPCGQSLYSSYRTCCQIGDLCLLEGLCQIRSDSASESGYYFGGCTDSTAESSACPGYCPSQYPVLRWSTLEEAWQCCMEGSSSTGCVLPDASNYGNYLDDISPLQLYATASVVDASVGSLLPTKDIASASRSAFSATYTPYSYTPYTYSNYYYYPTTTSSSRYPTYTGDSSSGDTGCPYNCPNYDGSSDLTLLLVVTIVPSIVGTLLITLAVVLCIWAARRRRRRRAAAEQAAQQFAGPGFGQAVFANGHQSIIAPYGEKQAMAMNGAADPEQQRSSQYLQPPVPMYGANRDLQQQQAPQTQTTSPPPQFLKPMPTLPPLQEEMATREPGQQGAAEGQNEQAGPQLPPRPPPEPPLQEEQTRAPEQEQVQSDSSEAQPAAETQTSSGEQQQQQQNQQQTRNTEPQDHAVPAIEVTPAALQQDQHHQEYYA